MDLPNVNRKFLWPCVNLTGIQPILEHKHRPKMGICQASQKLVLKLFLKALR